MYESLGASPYGGDLNKWPARTVDAYVLLQDEHNRVEILKVPTQTQTDPRQQRPQSQRR